MGASTYEALLIAAVLIAVGFALLPFVSPAPPPALQAAREPTLYVMSSASRLLSAAVAIAATAAYCAWFWTRGRRTLAMKTWRLRLTTSSGTPVDPARALARYLACFIGPVLGTAVFAALQPSSHARWAIALLAANYAWALLDPKGRFLQDRITGTRLVRENP